MKTVSFSIDTDMSLEEMASEILTAAHDALNQGLDAAAEAVLNDGLAILQMTYPEDPRVHVLTAQMKAMRG